MFKKSIIEQGPCDKAVKQSLAASDMEHSGGFGSKLAFAFALVAAFTAIIAGVLSFVVWNYQFDRYVRTNLQVMANTVASAGAHAYQQFGGWNFASLAVIPQVGKNADINVQILSSDGTTIYDEAQMRAHAEEMMNQADPDSSGEIDRGILRGRGERKQNREGVEVPTAIHPTGEIMTAPIVVNSVRVGTVRVWASGSNALLTDRDIELRSASLTALALAAVLAILVASVAGLAFARQLTSPINCITEAALQIRAGNTHARTRMTGDDEISLLGQTFDEMADSIEAERMLERRLTSDVAHELRTPLMAIQATVEAMEDGVLPADAEHLGTVRRETRRLSRLTNAILELSRLESNSTEMNMEKINVVESLRAAIDAHSALFDMGNLSLEANFSGDHYIIGNADGIQQAVSNFISNAARYTPEGGTVTISVGKELDNVVIKIADTGIGISQEDVDNLFRRFWRADDARTRQTGGVGVGLAIAKEIIDRHGGKIDVDSELGRGTTFSIRIPVAN